MKVECELAYSFFDWLGLYFVKKENFYANLALKHVTHSLPSTGIINLYVYSLEESI